MFWRPHSIIRVWQKTKHYKNKFIFSFHSTCWRLASLFEKKSHVFWKASSSTAKSSYTPNLCLTLKMRTCKSYIKPGLNTSSANRMVHRDYFIVMKCDIYANRWKKQMFLCWRKAQSLRCPNWPAVTRCWAILWHSQRSASELKGWSWERSRTRCDRWRSPWVCCEGASASPACCFLENSCLQSPAQKQHPHVGFATNQNKRNKFLMIWKMTIGLHPICPPLFVYYQM